MCELASQADREWWQYWFGPGGRAKKKEEESDNDWLDEEWEDEEDYPAKKRKR